MLATALRLQALLSLHFGGNDAAATKQQRSVDQKNITAAS